MEDPAGKLRLPLRALLTVTLLNYVAQMPYYIHQYYAPAQVLPSLAGVGLLAITLIWFLFGYFRFTRAQRYGKVILASFLITEFLFYLQTQVSQFLLTHQVLLHVYHPDGLLLFLVFGIGYINMVTALIFAILVLKKRPSRTTEELRP